MNTTVTQDWVHSIGWKQQSILFSSLRGPDVPNVSAIKNVNRWMRSVCQHNADPSKNYMTGVALPMPLTLCNELEFLPVHYVHHFADGLAVIAYNHPDRTVAERAANYHYTIAEELFHFRPEPPLWFDLRHRDRPGGEPQPTTFSALQGQGYLQYMTEALSRFSLFNSSAQSASSAVEKSIPSNSLKL